MAFESQPSGPEGLWPRTSKGWGLPVLIAWDIENCRLPDQIDPYHVSRFFIQAFVELPGRDKRRFEFIASCSTESAAKIGDAKMKALQKYVNVLLAVSKAKNSDADYNLKDRIDKFIQQHCQTGGTVVLVTSDADFFADAKRVENFGLNLELVYYSKIVAPELMSLHNAWKVDWAEFLISWGGISPLTFPYTVNVLVSKLRVEGNTAAIQPYFLQRVAELGVAKPIKIANSTKQDGLVVTFPTEQDALQVLKALEFDDQITLRVESYQKGKSPGASNSDGPSSRAPPPPSGPPGNMAHSNSRDTLSMPHPPSNHLQSYNSAPVPMPPPPPPPPPPPKQQLPRPTPLNDPRIDGIGRVSLHVKGFPQGMNDDTVKNCITMAGQLTNAEHLIRGCDIVVRLVTREGQHKWCPYAFINVPNRAIAEMARQKMDGFMVGNIKLVVTIRTYADGYPTKEQQDKMDALAAAVQVHLNTQAAMSQQAQPTPPPPPAAPGASSAPKPPGPTPAAVMAALATAPANPTLSPTNSVQPPPPPPSTNPLHSGSNILPQIQLNAHSGMPSLAPSATPQPTPSSPTSTGSGPTSLPSPSLRPSIAMVSLPSFRMPAPIQAPPNRSVALYVKGFPQGWQEEQVRACIQLAFASQIVNGATVVLPPAEDVVVKYVTEGEFKGFPYAFVNYESMSQVKHAESLLNGFQFGESKLQVNVRTYDVSGATAVQQPSKESRTEVHVLATDDSGECDQEMLGDIIDLGLFTLGAAVAGKKFKARQTDGKLYAIVKFEDEAMAQDALALLNEVHVAGVQLEAAYMRNKTR